MLPGVYAERGDPGHFLQVSIEEDLVGKIRQTVKRLREVGTPVADRAPKGPQASSPSGDSRSCEVSISSSDRSLGSEISRPRTVLSVWRRTGALAAPTIRLTVLYNSRPWISSSPSNWKQVAVEALKS